jgi:hypothetical protein
MIHDIINILLTLFLVQQIIAYTIKNYIGEENLKSTDSSDSANMLLYMNNKIEQILKEIFLKQRDNDVVYNPLAAPEQRVEARQYPYPNNNKSHSFWQKTRGEPDDYQLVGLLYNTDVNKNFQLYGRRVYPGSYEWEYYIRGKDAGGLDIKYPIQLNNKEEIRDGMELRVPIDKNTFTVSIYNYDQPRYNPFPFN